MSFLYQRTSSCDGYLFPRLSSARAALGLQHQKSLKADVCLVLGKGYVGILMQTKDLRRIVQRQSSDVKQVALYINKTFEERSENCKFYMISVRHVHKANWRGNR